MRMCDLRNFVIAKSELEELGFSVEVRSDDIFICRKGQAIRTFSTMEGFVGFVNGLLCAIYPDIMKPETLADIIKSKKREEYYGS